MRRRFRPFLSVVLMVFASLLCRPLLSRLFLTSRHGQHWKPSKGSTGLAMEHPRFDVLNANVAGLQAQLESGSLNSVEIVSEYLKQIDQHNEHGMQLRAVISVAPKQLVLERARKLDKERREKGSRGPFHGIPILLKDIFCTTPDLGLGNTCGTAALVGATCKANALIVDKIISAGMIIVGKANLSELALMKAIPPGTAGWSSAGGQCRSPYVRGGVLPDATFLGHSTPGGSSSGSGAGVAAGFCPISLGGETDGSIVQPAARAGLYALKPASGTVPLEGIMPRSPDFDSIGCLARTTRDVADMTSLLLGGVNFSDSLRGTWDGITVGFVNYDAWKPASFVVEPVAEFEAQTREDLELAAKKIQSAGGRVVQEVSLPTMQELGEETTKLGAGSPDGLWNYGFAGHFDKFLSGYDSAEVHSLKDLVEYNKAHADICLPPNHPSQAKLEDALKEQPDPTYGTRLKVCRETAQAMIYGALSRHGVDVIIGMGDGRIASVGAIAGYAVASMPLGYAKFNGRAYGLHALAGPNAESKLIRLMSAWEATFPEARQAPPLLVNWMAHRDEISQEAREDTKPQL